MSEWNSSRTTVRFWPRFFAALIDTLFTTAILMPLMHMLFSPRIFGPDHQGWHDKMANALKVGKYP